MSNFDPNAILRGAQLTFVGAHRALLNPDFFKSEHFKHALLALAAGVIINLLVEIPILLARTSIWSASIFVNLEAESWDEHVMDGLYFLQHSVLQLPFFLMNLMKFLSPALDDMFMQSLQWVDQTYAQKHKSEDPSTLRAEYYTNLTQYTSTLQPVSKSLKKTPWEGISYFLQRYGRKAAFSLVLYWLSFAPYVGPIVLPATSFYYFHQSAGIIPAVVVFGSGLVLPRRLVTKFIQTYFSSRSMMRELLEPYFSRIHFDRKAKAAWFFDREGVLFGFGVAFFLLIKIPFLGVLVYGIAEASTAYLITKITEPPPSPDQKDEFIKSQLTWHSKKQFMSMPLGKIDALNVVTSLTGQRPDVTELPGKKFT